MCVCVMFLTCAMQITDAQDADDLHAVFAMDEAAELLLSTGFRKPLRSLAMEDKECLILQLVLLDYHCLLKVRDGSVCRGIKELGSVGYDETPYRSVFISVCWWWLLTANSRHMVGYILLYL